MRERHHDLPAIDANRLLNEGLSGVTRADHKTRSETRVVCHWCEPELGNALARRCPCSDRDRQIRSGQIRCRVPLQQIGTRPCGIVPRQLRSEAPEKRCNITVRTLQTLNVLSRELQPLRCGRAPHDRRRRETGENRNDGSCTKMHRARSTRPKEYKPECGEPECKQYQEEGNFPGEPERGRRAPAGMRDSSQRLQNEKRTSGREDQSCDECGRPRGSDTSRPY